MHQTPWSIRLSKRITFDLVFYPLSIFWIGATAILMAVSEDLLELGLGIMALTLLAVLLLSYSMYREVRTVHKLVHAQRAELLARIDQLIEALNKAGVPVPEPDARYSQQGDVQSR